MRPHFKRLRKSDFSESGRRWTVAGDPSNSTWNAVVACSLDLSHMQILNICCKAEMTSLARQSEGLSSKKQRARWEPQRRVPWLISAWCMAFAFLQPPPRVTVQATAKIPPAAIGDGCLPPWSNSPAASAASMATGLAIEGSCRQNDSPAGCCQTNNANSVTWPPQSPEAVLLGGSLHEKVTGSRPTAPAVDWMLIRSDTQGHVDVQGSRSLNQATNTPAGLAAGHLNLTIDAAKRVNLTWNSINRPTCRASLASYLRLAHETSPGQFIDTNQASNQAEGAIDITVASYPGQSISRAES